MSWPCVLRIVVMISLCFSYNIYISPIFFLYNHTFSSHILLYLKQISLYIPTYFTLNVSEGSALLFYFSFVSFYGHFNCIFNA